MFTCRSAGIFFFCNSSIGDGTFFPFSSFFSAGQVQGSSKKGFSLNRLLLSGGGGGGGGVFTSRFGGGESIDDWAKVFDDDDKDVSSEADVPVVLLAIAVWGKEQFSEEVGVVVVVVVVTATSSIITLIGDLSDSMMLFEKREKGMRFCLV